MDGGSRLRTYVCKLVIAELRRSEMAEKAAELDRVHELLKDGTGCYACQICRMPCVRKPNGCSECYSPLEGCGNMFCDFTTWESKHIPEETPECNRCVPKEGVCRRCRAARSQTCVICEQRFCIVCVTRNRNTSHLPPELGSCMICSLECRTRLLKRIKRNDDDE